MTRLLTALLSVLLLAACAPVADFTAGALNEIGESLGVLSADGGSVTVTPPSTGLERVHLDLQGTGLTVHQVTTGEAEDSLACTGNQQHVTCTWAILTKPATVTLSGQGVSATATYRLPSELKYRHEILSN